MFLRKFSLLSQELDFSVYMCVKFCHVTTCSAQWNRYLINKLNWSLSVPVCLRVYVCLSVSVCVQVSWLGLWMWFWTQVLEWLLTESCYRRQSLRSTGTSPLVSPPDCTGLDGSRVAAVGVAECLLTLSCVLQARPGRRSRSTGIGWSPTCCRPSPSLTMMKTWPPLSKGRSVYVIPSLFSSLFLYLCTCQ